MKEKKLSEVDVFFSLMVPYFIKNNEAKLEKLNKTIAMTEKPSSGEKWLIKTTPKIELIKMKDAISPDVEIKLKTSLIKDLVRGKELNIKNELLTNRLSVFGEKSSIREIQELFLNKTN